MGTINENIAENITRLRKINNMTQQDLASKLNYSDKAISKWERGDSIPDIEMLCELSKIFNVDVDYLTKEHSQSELQKTNNNKKFFIRNLLMLILFCVSVFTLSTIVFVLTTIKKPDNASIIWVAYLYALPICSLFANFYARKAKYWLMRLITISIFLWTVITSVYLTMLVTGYASSWLLYILGVPIQAAILVFFLFKKTF